jgi:hypothetical protein
LREKYTQVVDSKDEECSDHSVEDVIEDMEVVLDPELHPLSYIDFQFPDESLEPETEYELTQNNSVPLSFNSFQFLKKNFNHVMDDKHTEDQEFSVEPMQQISQFLQDPVVDFLDDLCCQSHGSWASYELKRGYDQDMIRQSVAWSASAGVSFQSSAENLQPYQKLHEDAKSIDTVPDHVVDLAKFKNQGTGQFYLDPIVYLYGEIFHCRAPIYFWHYFCSSGLSRSLL